jgi:hemerythrin superfamily protein
MPTTRRKTTSTTGHGRNTRSTSGNHAKGPDAIALLRADHAEVSKMFKEFEKARSDAAKKDLASRICIALSVHTCIEEEIFYPAAKATLGQGDQELVPEAKVEHATLKEIIMEVEDAKVDEMFAARMQVLGEYVKHHVNEEQTEMFPKVRSSGVDLHDLGTQLRKRKQELMGRLGAEPGHARRGGAQLPSSVFSSDREAEHHVR